MGLFDNIRDQQTASRLEEERLFQSALEEIESGQRRPGLWAKALSESAGDEAAAKAMYLKLLVQRLKDDAHIEKRKRQNELQDLAREQERKRRRAEEEAISQAKENIERATNGAPNRHSASRKPSDASEHILAILAGVVGLISILSIIVLLGRG